MAFQDKPAHFPDKQVNGSPLKPITQVLLDRRATVHFKPDPVPAGYLEAIMRFAAQSPSGYNLQPWQFVVVTDADNRRRLQKTAMDQAKVGEAPVVIIAFAVKGGWKQNMDAIFQEGVRRGAGEAGQVEEQKKTVTEFLEGLPAPVWLNRQTMIAFTTMMMVAEAYGLDTAPMEGFDPEGVKREVGLPSDSEVIALLAIGFARGQDKPYAGRIALEEFVHRERYGFPWMA
jgi:nitroreductase